MGTSTVRRPRPHGHPDLGARRQSIGGPDLAVTTARGLWVAIYYLSFLAVFSLAAAIPHRVADGAP